DLPARAHEHDWLAASLARDRHALAQIAVRNSFAEIHGHWSPPTCRALPTTERARDEHLRAGGNRRADVLAALATDEDQDVRPHAVLLVDHPEPEARELAIEIDQRICERRARGIDLLRTGG